MIRNRGSSINYVVQPKEKTQGFSYIVSQNGKKGEKEGQRVVCKIVQDFQIGLWLILLKFWPFFFKCIICSGKRLEISMKIIIKIGHFLKYLYVSIQNFFFIQYKILQEGEGVGIIQNMSHIIYERPILCLVDYWILN